MRPAFLAAVAFVSALFTGSGALAATFTAGERHLTTTTASAAARNHGDGAIHITLWYPSTGAAHALDIGPPDHAVFLAGQAAADGPFADDVRRPTLLLSHGFGGSARSMAWYGTALARAGFVVIAVDHPGTNGAQGVTAEGVYAPWERPRDLQAALDKVLAVPELAAHVDARRIGVTGFSLGGFTSLVEVGARQDLDQLVAFCNGPHRDAICDPQIEYHDDFNQMPKVLAEPGMAAILAEAHADVSDPRVKAAFVIAPAVIQGMRFDSLRAITKPVGVALGSGDTVAPPDTNGELAAKLIPGATLDVLPGVRHYDFLPLCGPGASVLPPAYCAESPGVDRQAAHDRVIHDAVTFFDRTFSSNR